MLENSGKAKIREATVAGLFYPEDGGELERGIEELLGSALPLGDETFVSAILSPHASFGYSGDLAALAWKAASRRRVKRVLVLAPLHRAEEALVYLPESEYFDTPLGAVRVDRRLVNELRDCGTVFSVNDLPHFEEHGIELQLPFMRVLFPEASLVPVILGKPNPATIKALAAGLGLVFGSCLDECLVVVSSDLASGADAAGAAARSDRILGLIDRVDWHGLLEPGSRDEPMACGVGCVAAYLASSLSAGTTPRLLGRHDSSASRESGDERIVEYAALAFVRPSAGAA